MIVKTPLNLPSTKTDVNSKECFWHFIKKHVRGGKRKIKFLIFQFLIFLYFCILNQC